MSQKKHPFTIPLAFGLWYFTFVVPVLDFWLRITISTSILLAVAIAIGWSEMRLKPSATGIVVGVVSAVLLYLFFWSGYQVMKGIPQFTGQISSVYTLRSAEPTYVIAMLLVFPIGAAEEVYWRGLIQSYLSRHWTSWRAIPATSTLYALIHLPTLNPSLIFVALVGGLVWGYVYSRFGLSAALVSHILFDEMIFVLFVIS